MKMEKIFENWKKGIKKKKALNEGSKKEPYWWGPGKKNKKKHKGFGTYFDYSMYDSYGSDSGDDGGGGMDESIRESKEKKHSGILIALWPEPDVVEKLMKISTEDEKDLHLTLLYLKPEEVPNLETLKQAMERFSKGQKPISAQIGGMGRFSGGENSDGKDVIWASVDAPSLDIFRQNLISSLKNVNITNKPNHGYTPHITLSYIDKKETVEFKHFDSIETNFKKLVVSCNGEYFEYNLE